MYRTHTCGELRLSDAGKEVTIAGWVQRSRKLGGMTFIDLRDRYGITQLAFDESVNKEMSDAAQKLGREYVVQVKGEVKERSNKNMSLPTGEIEIIVKELNVLSESEVPPFTIEDKTDGGDDLRMKYRYLDLRRNQVRKNLELRSKLCGVIRNYLNDLQFIETETPVLINSTPEGARDFVVPSRMNPGQFYALPQSPQLFKQILMIAGWDRYYQIVKCFLDEDLRADRQPEFTQIDCEMSFVKQEDVMEMAEGMVKKAFKELKGIEWTEPFQKMTWADAMDYYGSDKPDLRFGMKFVEITDLAQTKDFKVFNEAGYVACICAKGCAGYTRKELDALTDYVKRPQVGAKGLVYVKWNEDGSLKSSVDKFYGPEDLQQWCERAGAEKGDLLLVMSGDKRKTQVALGQLRLEMGDKLGLRDPFHYAPLWVVDFPMFEWDEDSQRYKAMHHPFTMPQEEDLQYLESEPGKVRAYAYDMVLNGVEMGGGSVRIHDRAVQSRVFKAIGLTQEQAEHKFGYLLEAFKYGAPPHAGLAFGLDRFVALLAGLDSIRDCIAFPKNNKGRDVMIEAPSRIDEDQLKELQIKVVLEEQ